MNDPVKTDGDTINRINREWEALNAIRETLIMSTRGDTSKATYDSALNFGGILYPELLGDGSSVLRRARESRLTREYRQAAGAKQAMGEKVSAKELAEKDYNEIQMMVNAVDHGGATELKRKLAKLSQTRDELDPVAYTEQDLILRDVYDADRSLPCIKKGHKIREFELPDDNILRITVYHPDKPEHISGADLMYEVHDTKTETVSVVLVQYKIWKNRTLYLSDERMMAQIRKMKKYTCEDGLCVCDSDEASFRFPYCASFLKPTDYLQSTDQKLRSTGEHIPVCKIEHCSTPTQQAGKKLEYKHIKGVSLSYDVFEAMFNRGRVGSRKLTYAELGEMYEKFKLLREKDRLLIHAQDFTPLRPKKER